MSEALSDRVEDIVSLWQADIRRLLGTCGLHTDDAREYFARGVRRKFMEGIHHVFADTVLGFLDSEFNSDAEIAESLGLKDRTSISHMRKNRRIDGPILTYVLREFGGKLALPSAEVCDKGGYLFAVPNIRKVRIRDENCGDDFSLEDLECLLQTLPCRAWREAQRDLDMGRIRRVGKNLLDTVHDTVDKPWRVKSVPVLEQTLSEWREPFLLCAWIVSGEAVTT